ncbi:hypothetical protein JCM5350_005079 [Sporobolomyces pararoseus]
MNSHTDPFHRRESYHSSNLTPSAAQERRRKLALDAQKERRTHAIEAARSSSRDLVDLDDLSIAGSNDSSSSDVESSVVNNNDNPQTSTSSSQTSPPPHISKQKRKSYKPTFKSWAKNLLCQAETLDLREGVLPYGIERDYRMSVVPKGKRCLCATTNDSNGKNTILYSRVAGRTLARLHSTLPGDCLLDVVWDRELSILWVLDTCKWRSQYTVDCEADFRAFFTQSKLSELSTQYYIPPASLPQDSPSLSNPSLLPLLILPAPTYSSPLVPSTLLPILSSLSTPSPFPITVLLPSNDTSTASEASSGAGVKQELIQIPFEPTGILLYHRESHYESGLTALVNWIPLKVIEPGRESCEGVERFRELVTEWERRGSETGLAVSGQGGDESQMVEEPGQASTTTTTMGDFTTIRG